MAFRCTRLALQGAAQASSSGLLPAGASAPSSFRVISEATRSMASSSRVAADAASASASASSEVRSTPKLSSTLNQLRKRSALSATLRSTPVPTPSEPAECAARADFEIPSCLLPTETHPKTHNIHVATLHLRSYHDALQNLDLFADFARKAAFALAIPVSGTAHLPTRTSLWTVPRSPFVHKKSQENFWRKTHSRAIKVFDANDEVVDRWMHFLRIHAMPGVGMKAELMRYHEIGIGAKLMEEALALQRPSATTTTTTSSSTKPATATATAETSGDKTAEQSAEDVKRIADDIVAKEEKEAAAEAKA